MPQHKAGKKNRKHKRHGRAPSMGRYEAEGRDQKNKERKLLIHLKDNPGDQQAKDREIRSSSWYKRKKPFTHCEEIMIKFLKGKN